MHADCGNFTGCAGLVGWKRPNGMPHVTPLCHVDGILLVELVALMVAEEVVAYKHIGVDEQTLSFDQCIAGASEERWVGHGGGVK